jgi:DNA-binding NarL/FixJ family response regulator
MPIKVLVADHTDIVRRAISLVLKDKSEIELVGEACDLAQTMQMTRELQPQIVVLDIHMPDRVNVTPQDLKHHLSLSGAQLVVVSIWNDAETKALAESFGATSFLDKNDLSETLIPTILSLAAAARAATT